MDFPCVFSADLHGNELQYQKLVDFAVSSSAKSVIIGGDITPSSRSEYLMYAQRAFISRRLPRLLAPLEESDCHVYLIMGNDDCACNMDVLEANDDLFQVIHSRRVKLTEDFEIVGYSHVPITPFTLKDWEKFDLTDVPSHFNNRYKKRKVLNYRKSGFRSRLEGWQKFHFTDCMEKNDSIQKDLNKNVFTNRPHKTVYVIHTPPDDTKLDQGYDGSHLGSFAVKLFIEEIQPYLTLHGHIHETVAVSGEFKEKTGNSLSLTAGNQSRPTRNMLAAVIFDLYHLENVRRKII